MTTLFPVVRFAAAIILYSSVAQADEPPRPPRQTDAIQVAPTLKKDFVRELRLGSYVAVFEETPLGRIQDAVGAGQVGFSGDAAESIRWLCYSLPGQLLWLISGEMGGSEMELLSVVAEEVDLSDSRSQSCPSLPKHLQPVSLNFGWIGTTQSSLEETLGPPSGANSNRLLFYYLGKKKGPYQGPGDVGSKTVEFDVSAYAEVRVRNGRVVAITASHITSY